MRTVTVSHNWYSFLRCSGTAIPTVFGVPPNISCWDWGRMCQAWSGLVGMKLELGHSLTKTRCQMGSITRLLWDTLSALLLSSPILSFCQFPSWVIRHLKDWLPYFSSDLCWSLGEVCTGLCSFTLTTLDVSPPPHVRPPF